MLVFSSSVWAQGAAAGAPAAAPEDPMKFSTDSALMLYNVKPEKTADFEAMWAAIRAKLAASDKPELKALGDSLRIYKSTGAPNPGQGQTYFFVADPASKTTSYNLIWILYSSGLFPRPEAEGLFNKVGQEGFIGINAVPITKVQ